jgi:long-chain acyl-CoA synthetase
MPKLLRRNSTERANRTAVRVKRPGAWQEYTWRQCYETVKDLSLGLVSLGLERGDVVCIIGDRGPERLWGELAVQAAGGISAGISTDAPPPEVKRIAGHSGARFAIVDDQEQAARLLESKEELPSLEKVVCRAGEGLDGGGPFLLSLDEAIRLGKEYEEEHPGLFEENVESGSGDDTALICYTTGSRRLPGGAKLSHRALISSATGFISRYPLDETEDLLSTFPAATAEDSFFATVPHLLSGACLSFAQADTVIEGTRRIRPTVVIYDTRQWESIASEIQARMAAAHPLKRPCYNLFLAAGQQVAEAYSRARKPGILWRLLDLLGYLLLFRWLKDGLGMRKVWLAVTGSSGPSREAARLLHAIGIPLRKSYATTEAGLVSSHGREETDFETLGRPARNAEVRVTDDGELLVRSQSVFAGYHRDEGKTAAVLVDGWCHIGDAVNIDEKGHLIFLNRAQQ